MFKQFIFKRMLALTLALVMCVGLLAGCDDSKSTPNKQQPTDNPTTNTSQGNSSTTPSPIAVDSVAEESDSSSIGVTTELGKPAIIYENDEFKLTAVEIDMETVKGYFSDEVNQNFIIASFDMLNEEPLSRGHREILEVGGCAYIDSNGNVAFTLLGYKLTHTFSEGLSAVMRYDEWAGADVWGFIDTTGNEVIKCEYESVSNFSDGLAAVKKDGKWGYIDTKGDVIIPFQFEEASQFISRPTDFHEGRAWVWVSFGNWNLIDTSGNKIGEPMNKQGDFCEGVAPVLVKNELHFVDVSGSDIGIVAEPPYNMAKNSDSIHGFSEGLAAVYSNNANMWGFIDKTGAFVIEPGYEKVTDFKNGLAGVSKNGKWGVIKNTGEMVIPYKLNTLVDPYTGSVRGLDTGLFVGEKTDMTDGAHGMTVEMITVTGESFNVEFPEFKTVNVPTGFKNNYAVWTDNSNGYNIRYMIIEMITK